MGDDVAKLKPWQVVEFRFFVGVRHASGRWCTILLKPTGQEIDLEALGVDAELTEDTIRFIPRAPMGGTVVDLGEGA